MLMPRSVYEAVNSEAERIRQWAVEPIPLAGVSAVDFVCLPAFTAINFILKIFRHDL